MTRTEPLRRIILQLRQIFLTEALTFIFTLQTKLNDLALGINKHTLF